MIHFVAQYCINADFSEQNCRNIETFLEAFRELDFTRFRYRVLGAEDGVNFYHIGSYEDADIQKELLNLPAYQKFLAERDAHLQGEASYQELNLQGSAGSLDNVFGNLAKES